LAGSLLASFGVGSEELELKAKLEKELPVEQDLTRWVFDSPL
jgi:hypothetical protein